MLPPAAPAMACLTHLQACQLPSPGASLQEPYPRGCSASRPWRLMRSALALLMDWNHAQGFHAEAGAGGIKGWLARARAGDIEDALHIFHKCEAKHTVE